MSNMPANQVIWDEMFAPEGVRNRYKVVYEALQQMSGDALQAKDLQAADFFMNQGITFTVYSDNK
ncbi:MAG: circularly permuted type 2 ATP-grasp protein, partial [Chitinophagaceae bacterium]|nr:circularly permuted type 2 ATP-grasp protein [Chitinophagaceae bacterium]